MVTLEQRKEQIIAARRAGLLDAANRASEILHWIDTEQLTLAVECPMAGMPSEVDGAQDGVFRRFVALAAERAEASGAAESAVDGAAFDLGVAVNPAFRGEFIASLKEQFGLAT